MIKSLWFTVIPASVAIGSAAYLASINVNWSVWVSFLLVGYFLFPKINLKGKE